VRRHWRGRLDVDQGRDHRRWTELRSTQGGEIEGVQVPARPTQFGVRQGWSDDTGSAYTRIHLGGRWPAQPLRDLAPNRENRAQNQGSFAPSLRQIEVQLHSSKLFLHSFYSVGYELVTELYPRLLVNARHLQ
jgi:hypothetical protein